MTVHACGQNPSAEVRPASQKRMLDWPLEKDPQLREELEVSLLNMAVIHISEADAARDFAGLMARVRAGAEVVIGGASPAVKLSTVSTQPGRLLSESIALAEAHTKELGYEPAMDAEFATDMEEIIRKRKPRDTSAWD